MKYGRQAPTLPPAADAGQGRRAGFTLLEVVVVIVVFGILSTAIAVNWSSFIRYQELRQDAAGFHKELMALKAKALESGDTIKVGWSKPDSGCNIVTKDVDVYGNPKGTTTERRVSLNKKVKVGFPSDVSADDGELRKLIGGNKWLSEGITVKPDNLNPYNHGRLIIVNGTNKSFCIQVDSTSIKPGLYYKSGANGWKRM
jgi:prepilin-type N-terminal cleavage/methylation domain-containing protein